MKNLHINFNRTIHVCNIFISFNYICYLMNCFLFAFQHSSVINVRKPSRQSRRCRLISIPIDASHRNRASNAIEYSSDKIVWCDIFGPSIENYWRMWWTRSRESICRHNYTILLRSPQPRRKTENPEDFLPMSCWKPS